MIAIAKKMQCKQVKFRPARKCQFFAKLHKIKICGQKVIRFTRFWVPCYPKVFVIVSIFYKVFWVYLKVTIHVCGKLITDYLKVWQR